MSIKIYKIYNTNTEKVYIGRTKKDLHIRLIEHKSHYKKYLNNKPSFYGSFEILKYGLEDTKIELLVETDDKSKEKDYIQLFTTVANKRLL